MNPHNVLRFIYISHPNQLSRFLTPLPAQTQNKFLSLVQEAYIDVKVLSEGNWRYLYCYMRKCAFQTQKSKVQIPRWQALSHFALQAMLVALVWYTVLCV